MSTEWRVQSAKLSIEYHKAKLTEYAGKLRAINDGTYPLMEHADAAHRIYSAAQEQSTKCIDQLKEALSKPGKTKDTKDHE